MEQPTRVAILISHSCSWGNKKAAHCGSPASNENTMYRFLPRCLLNWHRDRNTAFLHEATGSRLFNYGLTYFKAHAARYSATLSGRT